jgi:hypothetical protein
MGASILPCPVRSSRLWGNGKTTEKRDKWRWEEGGRKTFQLDHALMWATNANLIHLHNQHLFDHYFLSVLFVAHRSLFSCSLDTHVQTERKREEKKRRERGGKAIIRPFVPPPPPPLVLHSSFWLSITPSCRNMRDQAEIENTTTTGPSHSLFRLQQCKKKGWSDDKGRGERQGLGWRSVYVYINGWMDGYKQIGELSGEQEKQGVQDSVIATIHGHRKNILIAKYSGTVHCTRKETCLS